MLELMKELSFIPESKAIKLYMSSGTVFGERYDKVTYLQEVLNIRFTSDSPVYVEASRFLALLPFIGSVTGTENYLLVKLKNGAEYKLPYLELEFEIPVCESLGQPLIEGNIVLSVLKKTTLQNLVMPEMRCIYVDGKGAVSCNFLQGTVDTGLRSISPVLLPPDLIDYVKDGEGAIYREGDTLLYVAQNCRVWSPVAEFSESETPWYESIYDQAEAVTTSDFSASFTLIPGGLEEALKRLSYFGQYAVIEPSCIKVENSYEPVNIPTANGGKYSLEEIISVLPYGKEMLVKDDTLFLRNNQVIILISEYQEEE